MGLLQSLFGGGHQMSPPPGHKWVYDAQGNLVPAPIDQMPQAADPQMQAQAPAQAPMAAPTAPDPSVAQPAPTNDSTPISVVGQRPDNWQPHHAGVLGQISDYILGTHFGKENTRRNLENAMSNISTNPTQAMRRVMKVDPEFGEKLYEQFNDDKRQQASLDRQNNIYDLMADKYVNGIVGGMANAATADNWPTMKAQIVKFGQKYNKDFSTLPDTFDPEIATSLAEGVIPAAKQQQIKQAGKKEDDLVQYRNGSLNIRQQNADTMKGQLGVAQSGLGIRQQNANTEAGNAAETVRRDDMAHGDRVNSNANRTAPATSGTASNGMPFFTNRGRTQLFMKYPDGTMHGYVNVGKDAKGNIKWRHFGPVNPDAATKAANASDD